MKLTRPNLSDLQRTFTNSGEVNVAVPAQTQMEVDSILQPIVEPCRAMHVQSNLPSATVQDESNHRYLNYTAAAGTAPTFTIMTLRRGIWRITLQLSFCCTGAAPQAANYACLVLAGPDGSLGNGISLLNPAQNFPVNDSLELLVHLPTDQWTIYSECSDPVTVGATNRVRGMVYACHLV